MKNFIMQTRYNMCDLLEAVIENITIENYLVMPNFNYKQIRVYKDFCTEYYVITFPVDLLYINAFKGPKAFIHYIKSKLETLTKLLSQQSNQQS